MATNGIWRAGGNADGLAVAQTNQRGYHVVYRDDEVNHCPGCGRTHWYVGRMLAECAFCATAVPLEATHALAGGQIVRTMRRTRSGGQPQQAFAA